MSVFSCMGKYIHITVNGNVITDVYTDTDIEINICMHIYIYMHVHIHMCVHTLYLNLPTNGRIAKDNSYTTLQKNPFRVDSYLVRTLNSRSLRFVLTLILKLPSVAMTTKTHTCTYTFTYTYIHIHVHVHTWLDL